ncbi:replication initiation protein, partial [Helicobacter bizzozeronii]|uniref:replication initiation protein n=1 Tax=Helicobacter bizzozeronii TaxID=56877 RepID=UPI00255730E1
TNIQEQGGLEMSKNATLAKDVPIANPGRVVLHNDIYKVNLGKLGAWESNLLFAIFNKLKDNHDTIIHFTPQEVKEMIGDVKINNKDLLRVVKTLWKNIGLANFWEIIRFVEKGEELTKETNYLLFKHFTIVSDKTPKLRYMEVGINTPYFTHLLNELSGNFTAFQLKTFMSLRSKYAKTLYRLLVRFEDIPQKAGILCEVLTYKNDFEGFKEFMGIPKGSSIIDIERRVLYPACKELGFLLNDESKKFDLSNPDRSMPYETIYYEKTRKGRGNKVVGITFQFTLNPSAEMQKIIDKRHNQNRFKDAMNKIQREDKEKQEQKRKATIKAQTPFYNKQERQTLGSFKGLVGSLYCTQPIEWVFAKVKLIGVISYTGNSPKIIGLFAMTTEDENERYYVNRVRSFFQAEFDLFKEDKPPITAFAYPFEDYEKFVWGFVKDAR